MLVEPGRTGRELGGRRGRGGVGGFLLVSQVVGVCGVLLGANHTPSPGAPHSHSGARPSVQGGLVLL